MMRFIPLPAIVPVQFPRSPRHFPTLPNRVSLVIRAALIFRAPPIPYGFSSCGARNMVRGKSTPPPPITLPPPPYSLHKDDEGNIASHYQLAFYSTSSRAVLSNGFNSCVGEKCLCFNHFSFTGAGW
ncbi:hypothetical protein BaRGS_00021760 [Batillaria attramentaria]|uniref:Uncharacterized protein n=1 Tax=Batillaria attramentaria TaxID=370345 RepID=A0ABD0KIF5_9CAEN